MSEQIRTFIDGGINWNWYLQGKFNEENKTVHVLFYGRWHKYETPKHPLWERCNGFWMTEATVDGVQRVLIAIHANGIEYKVSNPQYVFKYRDLSHLVLEP